MAKIVEPKARHIDLATRTNEGLSNCIAAHGLSVATDEYAIRPCVSLRWCVEGLASFEQLNASCSDRHGSGRQVDITGR